MTPAQGGRRRAQWHSDGLTEARERWVPSAGDPANRWFSAASGDSYNELPTFPLRPSYASFQSSLKMASQCVVFDGAPTDPHRPASMPIYQTATFVQPAADSYGSYDYSRSGNPTRTALEKHIAMLERAHAAFAFTTGMAALNSVTRLLQAGDEMLVGTDIYGGMHRLVSRVTTMHGIAVRKVDVTDAEAVRAAITERTRMVHLESPSNPLMQISDIRRLAAVCREAGVLLSLDASMMPPVLMQAIPLGADVVVHSATKFLAGHSDTMAGVVCCRTEAIAKRIAFFQNAEGTGLSPFDCWLVLRGIKTMALRVERAQQNAERIAHVLREHPRVTSVHYAGLRPLPPADAKALLIGKRAALSNSEAVKMRVLAEGGDDAEADEAAARAEMAASPASKAAAAAEPPGSPRLGFRRPSERLLESLRVDLDATHPLPGDDELADNYTRGMAAYTTHFRQAQGGGVVMSFTTGSVHLSRRVVDALRVFKLTVSFGSCNSLVEMPCVLSHASVPEGQRTIPEDLVRLSVGVEHVHDLVADLMQAFELATHPHVEDVRLVAREGTAAALGAEASASSGAAELAPHVSPAEFDGVRRQLALLSERLERAEGDKAAAEAKAADLGRVSSRAVTGAVGALFVAGALLAGAIGAWRRA